MREGTEQKATEIHDWQWMKRRFAAIDREKAAQKAGAPQRKAAMKAQFDSIKGIALVAYLVPAIIWFALANLLNWPFYVTEIGIVALGVIVVLGFGIGLALSALRRAKR